MLIGCLQDKIKGYISYQFKKLVVSKVNAFPPLSGKAKSWHKRMFKTVAFCSISSELCRTFLYNVSLLLFCCDCCTLTNSLSVHFSESNNMLRCCDTMVMLLTSASDEIWKAFLLDSRVLVHCTFWRDPAEPMSSYLHWKLIGTCGTIQCLVWLCIR